VSRFVDILKGLLDACVEVISLEVMAMVNISLMEVNGHLS